MTSHCNIAGKQMCKREPKIIKETTEMNANAIEMMKTSLHQNDFAVLYSFRNLLACMVIFYIVFTFKLHSVDVSFIAFSFYYYYFHSNFCFLIFFN